MPRYRIQTPDGMTLEMEGDHFPTEEELGAIANEYAPKPARPELTAQATLPDIFAQPLPQIEPWKGGVVRSALPGSLQPEDLLPAVRKIGGEVKVGEPGDTHPDIIEEYNIPAVDLDQRGFVGPGGKFYDRETAATAANLPTEREPGTGRAHSTDLIKAQEMGDQVPGMPTGFKTVVPGEDLSMPQPPINVEAIAPWLMPPKPKEPPPSLTPVTAEDVSAITPEGKRLLTGTQLPEVEPRPEEEVPPYLQPPEFPRQQAPVDWREAAKSYFGWAAIPGAILEYAGLTPEQVPSGAEISKMTGIPKALTIPMASIARTAEGFAQWAVSESGMAQQLAAAAPGVGVIQWGKWIYDMIKGAGESSVDMIRAVRDRDWQRASDDFFGIAGSVFLLKGGRVPGTKIKTPGLIRHTYAKGKSVLAEAGIEFPEASDMVYGSKDAGYNVLIGNEVKTGFKTEADAKVELARVQNGKTQWRPDIVADMPGEVPTPPMVLNSQQKVREQMVRSEAKSLGKKVEIVDSDWGGDVAITLPDGTIKVSRPLLHMFLENMLKNGMKPEDAIASIVEHESIHAATRTLKGGDELAENFADNASNLERLLDRRRYLGRGGGELSNRDLGHEMIRFQLQNASGMTPTEYVAYTRRERITSRMLGALSDSVFWMRKKLGTLASQNQIEILDKISNNIEAAKKGAIDASKVSEAAKVYGDVRAQPVEGVRQVPVQEGRPGVLPQAEGRVAETVQVPLAPEKAPPAAPTVGAQPAAPATGKAEAVVAPKPATAEPAISEAKPVVEKPQAPEKVLTEAQRDAAELKALSLKIEEGPLSGAEMDRLDELLAKQRTAPEGPAMKIKQEEIADQLGLRYRGTMRGIDQYVFDEISAKTGAPSGITVSVPEGTPIEGVAAKLAARKAQYEEGPAMKLKDPEKGMIRLYSGRGGIGGAGAGGSWFTQRPERAASFGPDVSYVDVPKSVADKARQLIGTDYVLPDEYVRKAKPVPEPIEQKVWDLDEPPAMRMKPSEMADLDVKEFSEMMKGGWYGQEAMMKMASKVGPEDFSKLSSERSRLDKEMGKMIESWSEQRPSEEQFRKFSLMQLKSQSLKEWMDNAPSKGPAMRIKDMDEKQFADFLRPLQAYAGDDPAKQQQMRDFVQDTIAKEEQAEFEAKAKSEEPTLGIGEEEEPTIIGQGVIGAMQQILDMPIEPKMQVATEEGAVVKEGPVRPEYVRPGFKSFLQSIRRYLPGVTEDSVRWQWGEQVWTHLINASGKRLEDWRKALKLEGPRRYGTRPVADPPRERTREEEMDIVRTTLNLPAEEVNRMRTEAYARERESQKYRQRLITEIAIRLSKEAMPELKQPLMRKEVSPDDIDFENDSTKLGAYRSFSDSEASSVGFLQNWLDDEARVSKSAKVTHTRRLTILESRTKEGTYHLVSTYRRPKVGIMLYDPTTTMEWEVKPAIPGTPEYEAEAERIAKGLQPKPSLRKAKISAAEKTHVKLKDILPRYRVKGSILLREPVQNFDMRFDADPETGRSARKVFMDAIGEHGEAVESALDKIWMDFQHERAVTRARKKVGGEEGEEAPIGTRPEDIEAEVGELPSRVERGEGGMFTGPSAELARAKAGVLRSHLKYFSRGPMSETEAKGVYRLFDENEVSSVSDIKDALEIISILSKQMILGKRRGLRGHEYTALVGIDKAVKKHYFAIRADEKVQAEYNALKGDAKKEYLEKKKMLAMYLAMNDLFGKYENAKTSEARPGAIGEDPILNAFTAAALDRYGDTTRRTIDSITAQKVAPTVREIWDIRTARPGGVPIRRHYLEQFPPRTAEPSTLTAEQQEFVKQQAEEKYKTQEGPAMKIKGGYGPSKRVQDQLAAEGRVLSVDVGIGISYEDAANRGRELLQKGSDPLLIMSDFEDSLSAGNPRLSFDDFVVARAWGEELQRRSDHTLDKFGRSSVEHRQAFRENSLWAKRLKRMSTEAGKILMAHQGETDVDTGSFTAMERDFEETNRRTFTAKQAAKARQYVDKTQKAVKAEADTLRKIQEEANKPEPLDPQTESMAQNILRWAAETKADALAKIRESLRSGKMYAAPLPIPPDMLYHYVRYGAATMVEMSVKGGVKFSEWGKRMIKDLGPQVEPHLRKLWDRSKKHRDEEGKKIVGTSPAYDEVKKVMTRVDPTAVVTLAEVQRVIAERKGKPPTPVQARAIWNYAKKVYIDKGESDFLTIRQKIANDLGMSVQEVTEAMGATKVLRRMTDEAYRKMDDRRRVIAEARNWLKNQKYPGWQRFFRRVPRAFFIDKVFGHGTVGLITHAGNMLFDPRAWSVYFPAWRDMYKMVFSEAYHARRMEELKNDPLYITARRAGLQNNPFRYTDDYQVVALTKFFSHMIGNRGFDALKTLRQARFNQLWNGTPDHLKTPQMAALWADSVNHATGIVKTRFPEAANWTFFAPKLEASRWAMIIGDTGRAAKIFKEWRNSTPEQQYWAKSELKGKAAMVAMYASLLAMNQGLLKAIGSDQDINVTNPRRSDYMAFKIAGFRIGFISPMIGMLRAFANLFHAAVGPRRGLELTQPRGKEFWDVAGGYVRGKFSPFASAAFTAASQSDYQGRPVPWSTDPTPASLRRRGIGRMTWGEYAAETGLPIPFEEAYREAGPDAVAAVKEVWKGYGMDEKHIEPILRGLFIAGSMAATGARVSEDIYAGR